MASHTYIYGIVDPRDRTLFYIGRSSEPQRRFRDHTRIIRGGNRPMQKHVQEILGAGFIPELVILEQVEKIDAAQAEERWIRAFKPSGALYNQRDVCAIPRDTPGPRKPKTPAAKNPRGPRPVPSDMTADEMRAFRETQGWSMGELARRLGVTAGAVTRWERGERAISHPVAQLIRSWA